MKKKDPCCHVVILNKLGFTGAAGFQFTHTVELCCSFHIYKKNPCCEANKEKASESLLSAYRESK